jgi:hypothetical protein
MAALPDQLVYLIIRFTASLPDLSVCIRQPRTTTTLSLKQLIRPTLPFNHAAARLRLIYAGKVLADTAPLSTSLRLPPPPPRARGKDGTYNEDGPGSKSKGKQAVRNGDAGEEEQLDGEIDVVVPPEAQRYYIHCSLGDALSPADLSSEATLAQATSASLRSQYASQASSTRRPSDTTTQKDDTTRRPPSSSDAQATTTTPAPQGFDRLLSSGFTAQEISTLRTHFTTNLSYTHTPDTMPSPTTIRRLEDAWLDSTATDPSPSSITTAGEGGAGTENGWGAGFAVEEGGLDDMLWGYLTGFFWPLGGLVWGFREEGVWARRRQVAVVMGVVLNTAFGFMRWSQ